MGRITPTVTNILHQPYGTAIARTPKSSLSAFETAAEQRSWNGIPLIYRVGIENIIAEQGPGLSYNQLLIAGLEIYNTDALGCLYQR
jgi:hypothetical protein